MMPGNEIKSDIKEIDCLLPENSVTNGISVVTKEASLILDKNADQNFVTDKKESKIMEKETFQLDRPTIETAEDCNIELWKGKKIIFNKSLFAFRITLFLWFGAGVIPSQFLGIFLKHRGLAIVEFSFIFSMIFVFQFLSCFIAGIITDKIGNAKPVLMFLMLSSSSVLIAMSLTPNINSVTCIDLMENISNSKNLSSCYVDCIINNQSNVEFIESYTSNTSKENISFHKNPFLDIKDLCDISNISLSNISLNSLKVDCCNDCLNGTKNYCITVRNENLVVVYAILILTFYSVWSVTYRFMDFTAVSLGLKNDSHFGKERAVGASGELIIIILIGFVLTTDKSSGPKMNFELVFQIAACIIFCAFLSLLATSVPILPPGRNLTKKAFSLLKDIDILAFILLVFVAGCAFAFNYVFHVVFLEHINAPRIVVALHSVAVVFYGFIILLTSKWWMEKIGTNKLFVLGLLFYTANNTAYSFLHNSWWCLIIDLCVAFYFHLFWVAVVVHCRNVAPVGFSATLNALTGAVHFGIGRSSGVFFGGMVINYMGLRKAYRIMATAFFSAAILYSVFLLMRRKSTPVNSSIYGNRTANGKHKKDFGNPDTEL